MFMTINNRGSGKKFARNVFPYKSSQISRPYLKTRQCGFGSRSSMVRIQENAQEVVKMMEISLPEKHVN